MEKLKRIIQLCKCSVNISINSHKDFYQNIEQHIKDYYKCGKELDEDDVSKEVLDEIIKRDTIIHIQVYPDTPIGSYSVYHYDLDMAIDEMLLILEKGV